MGFLYFIISIIFWGFPLLCGAYFANIDHEHTKGSNLSHNFLFNFTDFVDHPLITSVQSLMEFEILIGSNLVDQLSLHYFSA